MANLLFQKGKIGNLELPNRMLMTAMVTNYCTEDGKPTERFIAYHEARAKGGIGLESTGACYVTMAGRGFPNQAGLHKDDNIPAWREFTTRIHAAGGKCSTQLYHAGRQTSTDATGLPLEAPSAIPCPLMGGMPVELTIERIHEIVRENAPTSTEVLLKTANAFHSKCCAPSELLSDLVSRLSTKSAQKKV